MKALNLHNLSVEAPPDPEIENILRLVASIFQVCAAAAPGSLGSRIARARGKGPSTAVPV